MANLFSILFVFIICLNLCFFVGLLIRRLFHYQSSRWKEVFYSLTVGWFVLSIVLALYYSKGTSSLSVAAIFIMLYLVFFERQKREKIKILSFDIALLKTFIWVNIAGCLFYLLNWVMLCGFNIRSALYPGNDFAFYSRLSKFLVDTGYESGNIDYFYPFLHKKIPYHYIEHWFTGGVSDLSGLANGHIYSLLYIPLLLLILYFGFLSLFDKVRIKSWIAIVFAFIAFFVSGFAFIYPNQIDFFHVFIHDMPIFTFIKLLPVYLLFLCVLFELEAKNYLFATCIAVFSGLVYSTTLPASICIGLFLWILSIMRALKRQTGIKILLHFGMLAAVAFLAFGLFYYQPHLINNDANFEVFSIINIKDYLQTSINIIIKIPFAILIVLSPYLVFAISHKKWDSVSIKNHLYEFSPFYIFIIFSVVSVIPYAGLHTMPNAHQLYRSMYFVSGNIAAIWILAYGLKSPRVNAQIISCLFLIVNVCIHFYYIPISETKTLTEKKFVEYQEIFPNNGIRFLYFRDEPNNSSYYKTATHVFLPAAFMQLYLNPVEITCANPQTILDEKVVDYLPVMLAHIRSTPINRLHLELYGSNIDEI